MNNLKNKKLKILFRTAGGQTNGTELGTGHLFRCINLGKNLCKHEIHFLIDNYPSAKNLLNSNGFKKITILKNNSQVSHDINFTKKYVLEKNIDLVIIDKFKTSIKYMREIKKISKVIYISDLWKIDFPVDLVINGFIGFKNGTKINKYRSKCLLGPNYQILNKKFNKCISRKRKQFDVLVTFGGFDEHHITEKFCKLFLGIKGKLCARIILGPATKPTKEILQFKKKYPRKLSIVKRTNSMYNEISNSKFGLCSGGITSYEFAAFNLPFGIVCQYKHQLETAKVWERKRIAKNFGLPKKSIIQVIHEFISSPQFNQSNLKSSIIDGNGTKRIEKEICKMFKSTR